MKNCYGCVSEDEAKDCEEIVDKQPNFGLDAHALCILALDVGDFVSVLPPNGDKYWIGAITCIDNQRQWFDIRYLRMACELEFEWENDNSQWLSFETVVSDVTLVRTANCRFQIS